MNASIFEIGSVIAYYAFFIILAAKGMMKISSVSLQLLTTLNSFIVGLIMIYAMPYPVDIAFTNITTAKFTPMLVGCVIGIISIFTLFSKSSNDNVSNHTSKSGWIILILGFLLNISGLFILFMSLYAPKLLGHHEPVLYIGVPSFIIFNIISAIVLYFGSSKRLKNKPNFFKWFAFFIILTLVNNPLITSFILLYAYPAQTQLENVPFWAGIITISFLPYSLILYYLQKNYMKIT